MKIAIVSSLRGGVGTFTLSLIYGLSKVSSDTFDVYVVSPQISSLHRELISNFLSKRSNFRLVHLCDVNKKLLSGNIETIFRFLFGEVSFENYDIVHFNYTWALGAYSIGSAFRSKNVAIVQTVHGLPPLKFVSPELTPFFFLENYVLKKIFLGGVIVVANSHYLSNLLKKLNLRAITIHNGIVDFFFDRSIDKEHAKRLIDIGDKKVILYVGSIDKRKNPLPAILGAAYVCRKLKNCFLILVHPRRTKLMEKVIRILNMYGVRYEVFHDLSLEELITTYEASDIIVSSSKIESFGYTILEAMACAAYPIVMKAGAFPEIVGNAGTLVEDDNPKSFARAIYRCALLNQQKLEELQYLARQRAMMFTATNMARKYLKIFNLLVEGCRSTHRNI